MGSRVAVVLTVASLLAPSLSQASALSLPGRCLPPGIAADALVWQTSSAQAVAFTTESGVKRAGLLEVNQSPDGREIVVVWVRGEIVYVDGAPKDQESPGWVDLGYLTPTGKILLDSPKAPCQWQKMPSSIDTEV